MQKVTENTIERHILIDEMKNNGIYVRTTEDESVSIYAVIDHEIVWHGGINLLGKEDAWDNLIRKKPAGGGGIARNLV